MSSPQRPDVSELLARAREIAGVARERVLETEAARRVSDDMIARMRQADLFRIMQPNAYGGFEYGFDVFAQIEAAIASGCGSTGWVYGLLASHQWLIACFSEAGAGRGLARPHRACGRHLRAGRAGRGGRRRLSGLRHWQLLQRLRQRAVAIPRRHDPATRRPAAAGILLLRTADITIDDNWRTMGLAGTGSKTIVADKAFVPTHRVLTFAELANATAPGMRAHANPLYKQSFLSVLPVTIVAPVLGMAEGALAAFLDMAKVRTTRGAVTGGNRRMAELTTVQMRVAEATACIDAAKL